MTSLLVYVNDIIITGNDKTETHRLKRCLARDSEIKELDKLK